MSKVERSSFKGTVRGFLGSTWLSRSTAATRLARTTKSFSAAPIDPIDDIFSTISEGYQSPDHLDGFQSVTRQLLANDVLGSLIQAQSDMLQFDSLMPYEPDIQNAHAADAYRYAQENLTALPHRLNG